MDRFIFLLWSHLTGNHGPHRQTGKPAPVPRDPEMLQRLRIALHVAAERSLLQVQENAIHSAALVLAHSDSRPVPASIQIRYKIIPSVRTRWDTYEGYVIPQRPLPPVERQVGKFQPARPRPAEYVPRRHNGLPRSPIAASRARPSGHRPEFQFPAVPGGRGGAAIAAVRRTDECGLAVS